MRAIVRFLVIWSLVPCEALGEEILKRFRGDWVTTRGRGLNGPITCDVHTYDRKTKTFTGTFYGTWQGVQYSYPAQWKGPYTKLRGNTTVDGMPYNWAARMDRKSKTDPIRFRANFESYRYGGHFDLWEVQEKKK